MGVGGPGSDLLLPYEALRLSLSILPPYRMALWEPATVPSPSGHVWQAEWRSGLPSIKRWRFHFLLPERVVCPLSLLLVPVEMSPPPHGHSLVLQVPLGIAPAPLLVWQGLV